MPTRIAVTTIAPKPKSSGCSPHFGVCRSLAAQVRRVTGCRIASTHGHLSRSTVSTYQRQSDARRARRHTRIAERLGELFAGREAHVAREMAMHFEAAGNCERGAQALRAAADYAQQRNAHAEAAELSAPNRWQWARAERNQPHPQPQKMFNPNLNYALSSKRNRAHVYFPQGKSFTLL